MILDLIGSVELGFTSAVLIGGMALALGSGLRQRLAIAAALTAWLLVVVTIAATGALQTLPDATYAERVGAAGRLGLMIGIPLAAILAAAFATGLRERLIAMPISVLIGLNSTRILGVSFLALYAAERLPAPFAPVAGWGDIAVGVAAMPLALAAARRPFENRGLIRAWNIFGLADLVVAVSLGVGTSLLYFAPASLGTGTMTQLPWLLIPGFAVPLLMASHVAIFYKLNDLSASRPATA
ncbi:MAG TPA: hypothetical protein VFR36_06020 [Sphingomicrobium sp.]|nr:hypothetical protein [Sphingomicrobium sp.]